MPQVEAFLARTPQQILQAWAGVADPLSDRTAGPCWIALRQGGRVLASGWQDSGSLSMDLSHARAALATGETPDLIELCLTHGWQDVPAEELVRRFANSSRGLRGLEIRHGATLLRIAPSTTIACNRAPLRELERLAQRARLSIEDFARAAKFRSFAADQILILPGEDRCIRLWRGGSIVAPAETGAPMLRETISGLSSWMMASLQDDGRMTYKYWPSRGREASSNNTIRQFMATVALGRIARRSADPGEAGAACRNLAYNMHRFYLDHDGFGTIIYEGKAKLGAMALAALAVLEFREAGLLQPGEYGREYEALIRGILHLWQQSGEFHTFLLPRERNDNQNFYPGEALLFLAALHRQTRDRALAARFMTSFRWYRDWHRANPNPAFVPWHAQAYVMFHEDQPEPELADFIFERCDWLLEMQQWGGRLPEDFQGRFYNPAHPEYGPPHASSTGVYMEGLADAWRLALRLGDETRAARYAEALRRGLRAVRQLQYRDRQADAWYVSRPEKVMGGMRTETYNNEIRVDNVQHCLMALLKLDAEPGFPWRAAGNLPV